MKNSLKYYYIYSKSIKSAGKNLQSNWIYDTLFYSFYFILKTTIFSTAFSLAFIATSSSSSSPFSRALSKSISRPSASYLFFFIIYFSRELNRLDRIHSSETKRRIARLPLGTSSLALEQNPDITWWRRTHRENPMPSERV